MKQGKGLFKILVADIQVGQLAIARVLDEKFELVNTDSLAEAKLLLHRDKFNLIICGMHFDDCKMFDLLEYVKEEPEMQGIPFLVIQAKRSRIPFESAGTLAEMFGALEMLDLQGLSTEEADVKVRQTIDRLFALQA